MIKIYIFIINTIETSDLNWFVCFPYFGYQSEKLKSELNKKIQKYFIYINVRFMTIGSFFLYKDKFVSELRFYLVYIMNLDVRLVRINTWIYFWKPIYASQWGFKKKLSYGKNVIHVQPSFFINRRTSICMRNKRSEFKRQNIRPCVFRF